MNIKYLKINKDFFSKKLNHIVSTRVDTELYNKVDEFSKQHSLSSSEVTRLILENYFYGDDEL